MREVLVDHNDYDENGTIFKRTVVRGIVKLERKYLVICSKYGDCMFPGGGVEQGETYEEALIREVKEESGYQVIPSSIKEKIQAFEKRKILEYEKRLGINYDLLEMEAHYYTCEVIGEPDILNLEDYEKDLELHIELLSLEEMIDRNEMVKDNKKIPWVIRELAVMKELVKMAVS